LKQYIIKVQKILHKNLSFFFIFGQKRSRIVIKKRIVLKLLYPLMYTNAHNFTPPSGIMVFVL